jgi:Flp pilus assembly protein CpaB
MLAVIAVAAVVGLGVVFTVKTLGLLNPPPASVVEAPPPPAPKAEPKPEPPPPPVVLVPVRHLFAGDAISPNDIRPRPLRPEEMKEYEAHKTEYLPAVPEKTFYTTPTRTIEADRPLRAGDLNPPTKPEALNARLLPGTRAVSVGVHKQHSAGGLIQVGDWVDVYLNTEVSRTDNPTRIPHLGLLVQHVYVVAKRDTLYSLYLPLMPGEPVQFTLATNPYRAALIEYGRTIGAISLVPVSASEKKRLDALRAAAMTDPNTMPNGITFAEPGTPEFKAEAERIEQYTRGGLAIGNEDLARVLNLKPIPPLPPPQSAPPPPAPPSPPQPVSIEIYTGVNKSGVATFTEPAKPTPTPVAPPPQQYVPPPPAQYLFGPPAGNTTGATQPGKN